MKTNQLKRTLGLIVCTLALVPSVARATQRFPSDIYYYLYPMVVAPEKHYYPPCSLCHVRGTPGLEPHRRPLHCRQKQEALRQATTLR